MYFLYAGNNAIPIQRDGKCLFRVVSCCMYNTEESYFEIRLSTVNKIMYKHYQRLR